MRDQAERVIQEIAPDVLAVFVLPSDCLPWDRDDAELWTAIAVVVPEQIDHESNVTVEGVSQGQALLDLCVLYRYRSGL